MKGERLFSNCCAGVLAFLLGFGGVACMVTGLELPVGWLWLTLGCAATAVLAVVLFQLRYGWMFYTGSWFLMLLSTAFWDQFKALCNCAMGYYHRGYGIDIPLWMAGAQEDTMILPLLLISAVVMGVAVWTVLRCRSAFLAVGLSLLPLISCVIVTVTVPENFAIVLLISGLALLMLTQSARRQDVRQGNRATAMLALPVTAALILLLILVPREGYTPLELPNWMPGWRYSTPDSPSVQSESLSGNKLKTQVDLTKQGDRALSDTPVMEITTDYSGTLYLRARDYDVYTGISWTSTPQRQEPGLSPSQTWLADGSYSLKITTKKSADYRFVPYYSELSDGLVGGMNVSDGQKEYAYTFRPLWDNWKTYWRTMYGLPLEEQEYLALPEDTAQWAEALVEELGRQVEPKDLVATAELIERYVNRSAAYDLQTDRMPEGQTDFARWFLEDSETGYCVHYATAAAVLLRAAGIPARYVEGYALQVGSAAPMVVREDMAHAWVEYYVNGLGWVVLDPTPVDFASAVPEEEPTTATTEPAQTTEPTESTTTPSTSGTQTTATTAAATTQTATPAPKKTVPGWLRGLIWSLVGVAAGAVLIVGQWLLRRYLRLRRLYRGKPNHQALARYREAKRLAKLAKLSVPEELTELAMKAKYSNHTLTAQELSRFDTYINRCNGTLCKKGWHWHLLLRLVFAAL